MKLKPLLATATLAVAFHLHAGPKEKTLDIYWIDSEGGGSTLVVTPKGESVLIDSGNPGPRDSARIHHVAAQVAGLARIDHLITTHFHTDHFGGAAPLSQLMPIGVVHDKGVPENHPNTGQPNPVWTMQIKPYREMAVKTRATVKAGDLIPLQANEESPQLSLQCLAANKQRVPAPANAAANACCGDAIATRPADTSDNANSAAFLLRFGDFKFFDGGDLTWEQEGQLVCPVNLVGAVDVYQVNHHGLDTSNNPRLVRSLAPTVSVMNNGPKKGCGPETFAALKGAASIQAMYQLHKNIAKPDAANTSDERIANFADGDACKAHYIKLTVAPDAKSYTLSIPATGHSQTFKTK